MLNAAYMFLTLGYGPKKVFLFDVGLFLLRYGLRLGKFLFSDPNITKHETYVATYSLGEDEYQGRKCIYDFAGTKFSVIEVFLFND